MQRFINQPGLKPERKLMNNLRRNIASRNLFYKRFTLDYGLVKELITKVCILVVLRSVLSLRWFQTV